MIEGLQTLLTLRLRNAPAADTIDAVVEVWLAVFMTRHVAWREDRDATRIQRAFLAIAGTVDFWPAPVQVLHAMPRPPESVALAAPRTVPMPPEVKAKLADWLKGMAGAGRTSRTKGQPPRSTPEELAQAEAELRQHHAAINSRNT